MPTPLPLFTKALLLLLVERLDLNIRGQHLVPQFHLLFSSLNNPSKELVAIPINGDSLHSSPLLPRWLDFLEMSLVIIFWQLAADRDRYLEKYAFPYCAKQADKYEKVAKIGQVRFN